MQPTQVIRQLPKCMVAANFVALGALGFKAEASINTDESYRGAMNILAQSQSARARFESLANAWDSASMNMSSPRQAKRLKEFDRLVEFGEVAIPWAKARLHGSAFWAAVLEAIVGHSPPIAKPGNAVAIEEAWLGWNGEEQPPG